MLEHVYPKALTIEDIDAELIQQSSSRSLRGGMGQGLSLLALSLLLFTSAEWAFGRDELTFISALVLVLLIHELGHFIAMRIFGFRDLQMFFIPFFGAAVSGEKHDATGAQRVIVALAGPLPGIVLGIGLMVLFPATNMPPEPFTELIINLLLIINFSNLIPWLPFDGGQVVQILFFSRRPTGELIFRVVTSIMIAWLAYHFKSWGIAIFAFIFLIASGVNARIARMGEQLRASLPGPLPISIRDAPKEIRIQAIKAIAPMVAELQAQSRQNYAKKYAKVLVTAWNRAIDIPPHPLARVALIAVYGFFVVMGILLCMPKILAVG